MPLSQNSINTLPSLKKYFLHYKCFLKLHWEIFPLLLSQMVIRSAPADCPHCLLEQNTQTDGTRAMNLLRRNLNKALARCCCTSALAKTTIPPVQGLVNDLLPILPCYTQTLSVLMGTQGTAQLLPNPAQPRRGRCKQG